MSERANVSGRAQPHACRSKQSVIKNGQVGSSIALAVFKHSASINDVPSSLHSHIVSMKTKQKRDLERIVKDNHIYFHDPGEFSSEHHKKVLRAIQQLSSYKFDDYSHVFTHESHQKPWRGKIKQQAQRIASLAAHCRRAQQNECGWRLKLESEILMRFSTEVTCSRCSSRLWRSEVEVLQQVPQDSEDLTRLKQRQANRTTCLCTELQRYRDSEDPGICRIFHDRADNFIKYRKDNPKAGKFPQQRPDRVFGFRETTRFRNLLDSESEGQVLRDVLGCSPYEESAHPVLFPFLVLEAKKDSGDSAYEIELQTGPPIKKLLDLQWELKLKNAERSRMEFGPLVWFLSNQGECWRVAAGFIEQRNRGLHYHILQLWSGDIRLKDSALQLLLIIDYIFDWARDSQREAIVNELRILAGRNLKSIADDSEIRSLRDPMKRFLSPDPAEYSMQDSPESEAIDAKQGTPYRWLDSDHCAIRSISWAHYRVSALYITKENLQNLLRSFPKTAVAEKHVRDLLRLFREAWKVTLESLEELELSWTGKQREDLEFYGKDRSFCAVFTVAAYFLPDWEHVVELTYIAIAQDAIDELKTFANVQQSIHVSPSELPSIERDHLVGYFKHYRLSSPRARLTAAMQQTCVSSRLAGENTSPKSFHITSREVIDDETVRWRLDATMLQDSSPKTRQLVSIVRKQCTKGRREPDEPFLRYSSTLQSMPHDDYRVSSIWNLKGCPMGEGELYALLACGENVSSATTPLCVYVLDDVPAPQVFPVSLAQINSFIKLRRSHAKTTALSKIAWNTKFEEEANSPASVLFNVLQQAPSEMMISVELDTAANTANGEPPRAIYHQTRDLPPHFRLETKTQPGHWTVITGDEEPKTYDSMRPTADQLVARKFNPKQITCLYTLPQAASRAGLKSKTKKNDRRPPAVKKEEAQAALRRCRNFEEDFKIQSITQRGDLKRRRQGSEESEEPLVNGKRLVGFAGDWMKDEELAGAIKSGLFGKEDCDDANKVHSYDEREKSTKVRKRRRSN